ncbi:hypothetical protein ACKWTF_003857 [Chironomus riparius]
MEHDLYDSNHDGEPHFIIEIILIFLELLLGFIALFCNFIIIVAFISESKLKRQTNFYVISLVIADFILDLIRIPFEAFMLSRNFHFAHNSVCYIRRALLFSIGNISILSLVLISVRRYRTLHLSKNPN